MDKGLYVLLGVVITLVVTILKEWIISFIKNKKEKDYISIQLIFKLDSFTSECANVVNDDGRYMGQRDADGYLRAQVDKPIFEIEKVPGDWKSLDASMIYDIHKFGIQKVNSDNKIRGVYDYAASPPDFDEYFEERQYQYSLLGKESDRLATRLRKESGMPAREWGEFSPLDLMNKALHDIEVKRQDRAERHKKMLSELSLTN